MKYIAQPDYTNSVVNIYSIPGGALVTTVSLPNSGPNGVILYKPSAAVWYMFVSYAPSSGLGAVDVYDFTKINLANPTNSAVPISTLPFSDSAVGLAIQPGTGNLYVATLNLGSGDSGIGVFGFTSASSYAAASKFQFSSYNDAWNDVAQLCANLAFDLHGNLWMTTFQTGLANQYLICYTKVDSGANSSSHFLKIGNGATTFAATATLPGSAVPAPQPMVPFSQPEGIAFDPAGNLWLGNNNDDYSTNGDGNGTLFKISSKWISDNLLNYTSLKQPLTADGYGGTRFIASNDPDVTVYYLNDAKFGGLSFDGFTLYAHDQNSGGDPANAVVWQFDTDLALSAATFRPSGITTSYPGNGGMAIFNTTPPSLVIRDVAGDIGSEPDTSIPGDFAWESPDIAVTQSSILATLPAPNSPPPGPDLSSDGTIFSGSAYAYVRVRNNGAVPTTGTEVLKLYWAKASAGLNWPAPWDGLQFDVTAGNPVLGGVIGVQKLGVIAQGNETIFEFLWTGVPNSSAYTVNDQHFCLLARVETSSLYPFGMTFPEQTDGIAEAAVFYNTAQNSKIAWRNIAIVPVAAGHFPRVPLRLGVIGANYSSQTKNVRFAVQMLARDGRPAAIQGELMVHADGAALERLLETKFEEEILRWAGNGRFHLRDLARGLDNIRLYPNEILPFHVEFMPAEHVRDFAIRVVQYVYSDGVAKVVGGQTFVVGRVEGFPVRSPGEHVVA